jgi:16S rRNA (guanine527-N7)-methyltransferase
MHPGRIAELLEPFLGLASTPNQGHSSPGQGEESAFLTPAQLQHISTYIDILLRWNTRINLTAIRDPEDIVPRHFGESLFAARHLFPRVPSVPALSVGSVSSVSPPCPDPGRVVKDFVSANSVADIGSGAGFPGLPLKLWAPQISLTLIESNFKKSTFLREVTRALTLTDVNIQTARAETLSPSQFDVVTLRAVEQFASILPTAASMVAPGGRLALLISSAQAETALSSLPHLAWDPPIQIPTSRSRIMLTARVTADLPTC